MIFWMIAIGMNRSCGSTCGVMGGIACVRLRGVAHLLAQILGHPVVKSSGTTLDD